MNESKPVLEVKQLSKTFREGIREVQALMDVSLSIERGRSVAIMGASGSGKSTLLHLIAGLTRPDSGEVLVEGTELFRLRDGRLTRFRRDRIGLVFQSFNLVPALTAEENVLLPLLSAGKTCDAGHLDELLKLLGIADRRNHRPDALSGGEQQRVAIARALITEPSVVLADEPTGSLDSQNSQTICELLRDISANQNRTIITVTHEPSVAIYFDEVVVLRDGRIISRFETAPYSDSAELAKHYAEVIRVEKTSHELSPAAV